MNKLTEIAKAMETHVKRKFRIGDKIEIIKTYHAWPTSELYRNIPITITEDYRNNHNNNECDTHGGIFYITSYNGYIACTKQMKLIN